MDFILLAVILYVLIGIGFTAQHILGCQHCQRNLSHAFSLVLESLTMILTWPFISDLKPEPVKARVIEMTQKEDETPEQFKARVSEEFKKIVAATRPPPEQ